MNKSFKLYLKYVLQWSNFIYIRHFLKNSTVTSVLIEHSFLYYLILHFKLSSTFYSSQLVDMFCYELPSNKTEKVINSAGSKITHNENSVLVYNINSIFFQERVFIFLNKNKTVFDNKKSLSFLPLNSIAEIFPNANWLEREISELHGTVFLGKKDLRNLMLQYGDTTAPMVKSFPSIGTREIFYDSVSDLLIQSPTSVQF